jgi:hypothetical protein
MRIITLAAVLLGISVPLLHGSPAMAQTRTWVSGTGADANPCSRTAPCQTFSGAYAKTADGGIINCLDSGGFGALTINKSIEINCLDVHAGMLASGGINAINVNTAGIKVVLRGLSIEGSGASNGNVGVNITAAAIVHIEKVTIRDFGFGNTSAGIKISNSSGNAEVYISDSNITDNGGATGGGGVMSIPSGSAFSLVELRNVNIKKNTNGVGNTANSRMRISHASIAGNGIGVLNDPGSIVTLNDVDIVHNNTGISGATTSYGNNRISGQLTSDGTPPTPAGAQSHDAGQK